MAIGITGSNPFQRQNQEYAEDHLAIYNQVAGIKPHSPKDVVPIFITKEGEVIANRFIDRNDDFYWDLDKKGNIEHIEEFDNITTKSTTLKGEITYITSGSILQSIRNGWKHYTNSTTPYSNLDKRKFDYLNKYTRRQLNRSDFSGPFSWHFTHENSNKYPTPEIEGTWFAPFNYDVYIAPELMAKDNRDIIVIKSGKYREYPKSPTESMISAMFYSTGVSGNIYIHSHSKPDVGVGIGNLHDGIKNFKIPRSGNANRVSGTSEVAPVGPLGVFKDGVTAFSYKTNRMDMSYSGLGVYNNNMYLASHRDACNGQRYDIENSPSGAIPDGTYVYRAAPFCLYDTGNSTAHSSLIGYAVDGYPIYGPYGYSSAMDSASSPKLMAPSYRLKPLASRTNGPDYGPFYVSGFFVEDFEYVNSLGDLDEFNGRLCKTPEYPNGTYAYFTTVTTGSNGAHTPAFPYIIGDKFYGRVEKSNWESSISYTEAVNMVTGSPWGSGIDVDLFAEYIYGLKYKERAGLEKETILFASPHEIKTFSGVMIETGNYQYLGTGGLSAAFSGNLFSGVGNSSFSGQTNKFMAVERAFAYPTSKDVLLSASRPFSGNMPYVSINPDTNVNLSLTGQASVTGTSFFSIYSGYRSGMANEFAISPRKYNNPLFYEGVWDGKIPSGTPFKIEVWSFNGVYKGLSQQLKIYPCEYHPATPSGKTIFAGGMFVGEGPSKAEAVSDMYDKANKEINKQLDSFFIASGIMNPSKGLRKYAQLLRKGTF